MKISRRMFLGGAGALIALPVLESLLPRTARGDGPSQPPRRFIGFFVPNGIVMANWTPAMEGTGWAPTPILAPLVPYREKLLVISGLANKPGRPDQIGDHASGCGAFMTAVHVRKTEGADIQNGPSVDQVAAAATHTRSGAETVLGASEAVEKAVANMRDEVESFLKKVAV